MSQIVNNGHPCELITILNEDIVAEHFVVNITFDDTVGGVVFMSSV